MRVGLLGGSFNPAHEGHLHIARAGAKALGLQKVIWLVSQNPLKDRNATPPAKARLAGVKALLEAGMAATDVEAQLGLTYSVETLTWLRRRYPGVRLIWLMGADNLSGLHHWRRWREIIRQTEIAVAPRPGAGARARLSPGGRRLRASPHAHFLDGPVNGASSTALRNRAKARP